MEIEELNNSADMCLGDGKNFMQGSIKVMMGYDNLIFGRRIETIGGDDGILPCDNRLTLALKESKL